MRIFTDDPALTLLPYLLSKAACITALDCSTYRDRRQICLRPVIHNGIVLHEIFGHTVYRSGGDPMSKPR